MEFPSSQPSVDQFQVVSNEEQLAKEIDDDQLEETLLERIEGLKEMFPVKLRSAVYYSVGAGWTLLGTSFSLARKATWVLSTSAFIMILPYFIDKELRDMEKSQLKQQQQLLLGPSK
uniref:Mitochondrial import receptor subunit TOM22 homolog n=1 Tax=Meloidogyne incognita TaxID=6306 RepID=A0A914KFY5_MELIC